MRHRRSGNHDIGRAAQQVWTRARRGGRAMPQKTLLAYDLPYRPAPVVYYGDEVGIADSAGNKRDTTSPRQVPEWQSEERIGSGPDRHRVVVRRHGPSDRRAVARAGGLRPRIRCSDRRRRRGARRDRVATSRDDARPADEYLALATVAPRGADHDATATPLSEGRAFLGTTTGPSTRVARSRLRPRPTERAARGDTADPGCRPPRRHSPRDSRSAICPFWVTAGARPLSVACGAPGNGALDGIAATTRRRINVSTRPSSTGASVSTWSRSHVARRSHRCLDSPFLRAVAECRHHAARALDCPIDRALPRLRPGIWRTSGTKAACTALRRAGGSIEAARREDVGRSGAARPPPPRRAVRPRRLLRVRRERPGSLRVRRRTFVAAPR